MQIEHDNNGKAIFRRFRRSAAQGEFQGTDAKLIGELSSTYNSSKNKTAESTMSTMQRLIITTPNADYLPDVNLGQQFVAAHGDGRWGDVDFGQWPQWYFDDQDHFAYILRRPEEKFLVNHPLHLLWFDISDEDFEPLNDSKLGVLRPSIARRIFNYRTDLLFEVSNCQCERGEDYNKLQEIATHMRNATSSLLHTPQTLINVAITLTSAQRYILETRAFLDKITKWDKLPAITVPRPLDNTILGCVTDRLAVVHDLYQMGVPVWFVRPPSHLPCNITILKQCAVTTPEAFGINTIRVKGGHIFYQGPLNRAIHRTIQNWRPGTLDLSLLENISTPPDASRLDANGRDRQNAPYSKHDAIARVAQKVQRYALNKQLFQPIVGSHFSEPLLAWKRALVTVDTETELVENSLRTIFRGYAFPPPLMFSGKNEPKVLGMMLAWILIRPLWVTVISDIEHTQPLPGPQQWRDHLNDVALRFSLAREDTHGLTREDICGLTPASSDSHSISRRKQKQNERRLEIKSAIQDIFTISLPKQGDLSSIEWNGHGVWQNKVITLSSLDRKLVVWDSQEHNFRLEFMTLDRCVLPNVWKTAEGKASRQQLHRKLWPDGVPLMLGLPSHGTGLGATSWVGRRAFIKALQDILVGWPGKEASELSAIRFYSCLNSEETWDQTRLEEFERKAAKFYCQFFFNYFGRAPVIPHSFPVA